MNNVADRVLTVTFPAGQLEGTTAANYVMTLHRSEDAVGQADVNLTFNKFMALVVGLGVVGVVVGFVFQLPIFAIPVGALFLASLPFLWLRHRKKKRIRKFVSAMPEAVELISRALRAGHGLASGLSLGRFP